MKIMVVVSWFCTLLLVASLTAAASTNYDNYLLTCGGSSGFSSDNRLWKSDNNSTFSTKFESTTTTGGNGIIPFSTARIFNSTFTYSFPVSPGPKFIRLFFSTSPSPHTIDAYVSVQSSSGHLLLRNFSATCTSSTDQHLIKEFLVHVTDSHLMLTFTPTTKHAFVNGIEVVSVPEDLYINNPITPKNVDQETVAFDIGNSTALETSYRVNVGGQDVSPCGDSGNMSRTWVNDKPYLIGNFSGADGLANNSTMIEYSKATPNYTAPALVYETMKWMGNDTTIKAVYETMKWMGNDTTIDEMRKVNITWSFELDLGFHYLVRLHWCEISPLVKGINDRVFIVYLNGLVAEADANIYEWASGSFTPVYRDYVVYMDEGHLQLALHINTDSPHYYYDVLLNGLEIFKVSRADGSLNATNLSCPPITDTRIDQAAAVAPKSGIHILPIIIIGVIIATAILLLCCFFILRRRKYLSKTPSSKSKYLLSDGSKSSLPSHLCRHFTLSEIRAATSDFSDSLIVGHGGFGNVYKGRVETESGSTLVAIKRLKAVSSQGAREFAMEIELLSKLRHVNLVSLIGYCNEAGEMILVYEYMPHGTLRDQISKRPTHLSWVGRLDICVGAARGLNYLHTGTERMVIHRDVKSANILVDQKWVAKVSDFGLSKLGPTADDISHVSTAVKGSFGYVDPEYYKRQQLTEKSDVYSFGVVLFEVLCGRAAVNPNLPKEQVNLRMWGRRNQVSGTLDDIVDPAIKDEIALESLRKFGEVAESCVRDEGGQRPSMADVIGGLELALKLQMEATLNDQAVADEKLEYPVLSISSPSTGESGRLITNSGSGESTWTSNGNSTSGGLFSNIASQSNGGSTPLFSEIFKTEGR